MNKMKKGRVTIPTDENYVEGTKKIAELWGADAVRDCDGTHLPKNALEIAEKVYNTYFVVRGDNAWADKHTDELQSVLLMTGYELATGDSLTIDLLKGYSREQLGVSEEILAGIRPHFGRRNFRLGLFGRRQSNCSRHETLSRIHRKLLCKKSVGFHADVQLHYE